ncbi:MAG: FAD-dependent oxidoreductase [Marinobacter sp.]|nr:FAD-dependent oxidoreductase [Marinobacter sp.]
MSGRRLVIVGHGMVAQRLLEELTARKHPYGLIRVFNGEPVPAYNRILLSSVLAGEASEDSVQLKPDTWFAERNIVCHQGDAVATIDTAQRQVTTTSGFQAAYDDLVFATGSRPAALGIEGEQLPGVMGFRDLQDTRALIDVSQRCRRAVVIGGGFLGLEAAEGLRARGMAVTVLHRSDHLLNRQLDPVAGALLASALTARGVTIRTGASPQSIAGSQRARAVQLTDDTLISTDLVVVAAGITPRTELARATGLACDRGILVDEGLASSVPGIYALGECCQLGEETFGLVEPGYRQAAVLAGRLCGEDRRFAPDTVATRLKISGIPIYSCGATSPDENTDSVVWQDRETDRYCHLLIRNNRLTGAVLFGETQDGPWYEEQIRRGDDISQRRHTLAFGAAYDTH